MTLEYIEKEINTLVTEFSDMEKRLSAQKQEAVMSILTFYWKTGVVSQSEHDFLLNKYAIK